MILRDSINASAIPVDTPVVAGYGDGLYEWSPADWARFPNSVPLVIVVSAAHQGDILDVERFDATPADVPGWIDRFDRPGRRLPTIYCSRALIATVRAYAAGRPFDWWAATLDGTPDVPGAVAVQYVDVGPYDESVILDPSWVGGAMTPEEHEWLRSLVEYRDQNLDPLLRDIQKTTSTGTGLTGDAIGQILRGVQALQAAGGALTPQQAQELADAAAAVARIEAALKGA